MSLITDTDFVYYLAAILRERIKTGPNFHGTFGTEMAIELAEKVIAFFERKHRQDKLLEIVRSA